MTESGPDGGATTREDPGPGDGAETDGGAVAGPVPGGALVDRLPEPVGALVSGVRFGQFLSVGVLGAGFDFLVLSLLVEFAGVPAELAKLASAETAIVVMFVANERWTFADWGRTGFGPVVRRFLRSNAVRAGGAGVAWVVLVLLVRSVGVHYLVANAAGIGAGFVVNYLFESLFTWQVHAD